MSVPESTYLPASATEDGATDDGPDQSVRNHAEPAERSSDGGVPENHDGDQLDLQDRRSLRRVVGLSTELTDVSEVE
ncbi:MAG: hypothetical protein L0H41_03875, partial [Microlunatus sp.]|nr:hypothetical protein [Microlunatus sp.]